MIVTISNTKIAASINTFGAELTDLKKENTNYIWTIDENYWNKTSPVLFPIVGRLKNDTYKIEEKVKEKTIPKIPLVGSFNKSNKFCIHWLSALVIRIIKHTRLYQ